MLWLVLTDKDDGLRSRMDVLECLSERDRNETFAEGGKTYRDGWVREEVPTGHKVTSTN